MTDSPSASARIHGFDIARSLAICGMLVVHSVLVLGPPTERLSGLDRFVFNLCDGRAAATFVLLAGLGVGQLLARTEDSSHRRVLWRRAAFLGTLGVLNLVIWPGDILRLYGVALLAAPLLHRGSSRALTLLIAVLVLGFPVAAAFIDWDARWEWATLTYRGLWTPSGFVSNLVIDGFRPLIPWLAFFVLGLRLSRLDWRDGGTARRMLLTGGVLLLVAELASMALIQLAGRSSLASSLGPQGIAAILGTHSMPPMPQFILSAFGFAGLVIGVGFVLAEHLPAHARNALVSTGRLALTWYVSHILLLVGLAVTGFHNRLAAKSAIMLAVAGFAAMVAISHARDGAPMLLERMLRGQSNRATPR
ncbi:DUF418 domain-containing protein [Vitiosangium sp. GDMCC 1.1324]|uniref:DUF418 domain-containing protein n=1 Tax=Vitiosangium sp. (strain GDMCC 1.1324) TaxID=2138576 RepID=UPI000D3D534D|nr:heparan-alpha-glucosaminide N-acetyltransferase domain-containing protein [Vitiosangium sp. GDMCC 1.1324]PTL75166.1 hypothetical protein DAT35_56235 [Vitiosangium sp. GDMCC 1.1324]